jgi:hypothetical protein
LTRVLLPYALIVVAIASFFLPPVAAAVALAGQGLIYGLAALDGLVPDGSSLKRISSPARTFCMLMVASLWAVSVFFVPSSQLWKANQVQAPKIGREP